MTTRLSTVAPELVSELQSQSSERQRAVALAVTRWILTQVEVEDPLVVDAQDALGRGDVGDTSIRVRVEALVDKLDEIAWDAQGAAESTASAKDDPAYSEAFARARAVNALWCALSPEPVEAALESAYEAQAATGDLEGVRSQIRNSLA